MKMGKIITAATSATPAARQAVLSIVSLIILKYREAFRGLTRVAASEGKL